jgi:hypothetical protein
MYVIKYKKPYWPFWKKLKVIGHRYEPQTDRIDLYLPENGGILSIGNWRAYQLLLQKDFMEAQKAQMEEQAGQTIPVKRNGT